MDIIAKARESVESGMKLFKGFFKELQDSVDIIKDFLIRGSIKIRKEVSVNVDEYSTEGAYELSTIEFLEEVVVIISTCMKILIVATGLIAVALMKS